ncbi:MULTISPECIES: ATP-grasp domain-containing protein [unclassified Blastococcus]
MPSAGRALVLTSSRDRGALAAVRALDRAGWHVGVGSPDAGGMVAASRSSRRTHHVPRPRGHMDDFVAAVRRAVAGGGYDVVFGSGDDWMAALAVSAGSVPAVVVHPPAEVALAALDKAELAQRATDAGLPSPRTELATPAALAGWTGPVVVKCRAHWQPGLRQRLRIEARRYPDVEQARPRVRLLQDAGFEAVLQEPVDGELEALVGLLHEGRLHGRVQQRALRLWPTPSGVTSRAVTVPVDEELAAGATRLLTGLGWSGLVQLQFLRDDDGGLRLIDLNGRFFGSMALSTAAGPNLPDAWARQALGLPLPPLPDGTAGVRYLWTAGDLRRAAAERRGGLLADGASVLRWFPGAVSSVWDVRDPGPTLALAAERVRRRRV